MILRETLNAAAEILEASGRKTGRLDAEVLLLHILKKDRTFLIMEPSYQLSESEERAFFELIDERASGKPVSYITGEKEFMGLSFKVGPEVLIPRPDTELLVETGISLLKEKEAEGGVRFLDMCTGSGAIAISFAYYLPKAEGVGADISEAALQTAKENSIRLGVGDRLDFVQGDLFEAVDENLSFDLIASNPPYIKNEVIEELMIDVRGFEPVLALDGGHDGLLFYRKIVPEAVRRLKPGGALLLEIGHDQGEAVSALLRRTFLFTEVGILKDLAGLDRVVYGYTK